MFLHGYLLAGICKKKKYIAPGCCAIKELYVRNPENCFVMHKGIDVLVFMIKNQNCDHLPSIFIRPSVSNSHLIQG